MKKNLPLSLRYVPVLISLAGVFFGSGLLLGRHLGTTPSPTNSKSAPAILQLRSSLAKEKYHFINPLLACELSENRAAQQFKPLRDKLLAVLATLQQHHDISTSSIYFDTRDGRWLGINTDQPYYPASLLKVPVMLVYFRQAETNPAILYKKLTFKAREVSSENQFFSPSTSLVVGAAYTVSDLIERMIRYSDNNATDLLLTNLGSFGPLREVFVDLDVPVPPTAAMGTIDFMSVKNYARFFRVLYNASYLNREFSERALGLLSSTDFSHGLSAPLPPNVMVAHKFGERTVQTMAPELAAPYQELHDCGIIYYAPQPYLLCVMTKGSNIQKQATAIQKISQAVFEYLSNNFNR